MRFVFVVQGPERKQSLRKQYSSIQYFTEM